MSAVRYAPCKISCNSLLYSLFTTGLQWKKPSFKFICKKIQLNISFLVLCQLKVNWHVSQNMVSLQLRYPPSKLIRPPYLYFCVTWLVNVSIEHNIMQQKWILWKLYFCEEWKWARKNSGKYMTGSVMHYWGLGKKFKNHCKYVMHSKKCFTWFREIHGYLITAQQRVIRTHYEL